MRDINEVLALQDTDQKIYYLKKGRKTDLPDAVKLYNDWNPNKHERNTPTPPRERNMWSRSRRSW